MKSSKLFMGFLAVLSLIAGLWAPTGLMNPGVAAAATGTITGRVTDATTGLGISGAAVFAMGDAPFAPVLTDGAGNYTFGGMSEGNYWMQALAAGYETQFRKDIVVRASVTVIVDFPLIPGGGVTAAVITGTVVDGNTGAPVAGASIFAATEAFGGQASTDNAGRYALNVPMGTLNVTATANGYSSVTRQGIVVTAGQTITADFALLRSPLVNVPIGAGAITGTLIDEKTGAPIAGARVTARRGHVRAAAITDGSGKYLIPNLGQGDYRVGARAEGYKQERKKHVEVRSGEAATANFVLEPRHEGRGHGRERGRDGDDDDRDDDDRGRGRQDD